MEGRPIAHFPTQGDVSQQHRFSPKEMADILTNIKNRIHKALPVLREFHFSVNVSSQGLLHSIHTHIHTHTGTSELYSTIPLQRGMIILHVPRKGGVGTKTSTP